MSVNDFRVTIAATVFFQFLKLYEDIAPFPVYEWEHQYNGRSNTKQFLPPQLISSEAFAKPSCIIPCKFETVSNMVPKHTDKF